jgi:hypothetical protein
VGSALYTIGALACMRCGRRDHTRDSFGVMTLSCGGARCRVRWVALRLPPGSTGQQLLDLYGEDVARAFHGLLCPESDGCSQDALSAWTLPIPTTDAQYLQRLSDSPEPAMGWHRAHTLLAALFAR